MKNKNLIVGGVILVVLYYLLKKESAPTVTELPDEGDKDLSDVINGEAPQSIGDAEKDKLFTATLGYTGGARPSLEMIRGYQSAKESALRRVKKLGLEAELKVWLAERKKNNVGIPMSRPKVGKTILRKGMPTPKNRNLVFY